MQSRRPRKHIGFTLFLLIFGFSASALSLEKKEILAQLHDVQVNSYSIMVSYFMYSGFEGDSRYERQINEAKNNINSLLTAVTDDGQLKDIALIQRDWNAYQTLLKTTLEDFRQKGYAEPRVVQDLGGQNLTLINTIDTAVENFLVEHNMKVDEAVKLSREMSLAIQAIASQYAARATSNLGQVFISIKGEEPLDSLIKGFDEKLQKLKTISANSKKGKSEVRNVNTKWAFIKEPVSNYNESAIPFVVKAYGDRISDNLKEVSGAFGAMVQTAAK